jgi:hypothetical protein
MVLVQVPQEAKRGRRLIRIATSIDGDRPVDLRARPRTWINSVVAVGG